MPLLAIRLTLPGASSEAGRGSFKFVINKHHPGGFSNKRFALYAKLPRIAGSSSTIGADVARIAGAAGVHVGQSDMSPSLVREILGRTSAAVDGGTVVGVSTHNVHQVQASVAEPVDYIAVGPVFETSTKKNHASAIGLESFAEICDAVAMPVVAIGGIRLEHLADVFAAGASSVAVISDLIGRGPIQARTEKYLDRLAEIDCG